MQKSTRILCAALAFLCFCCCDLTSGYAQADLPEIPAFSFKPTASDYIGNWSPGSADSEEFLISRVPLAERFEFKASQVNPNIPHKKKMDNWVIMTPYARNSPGIDANAPYFWQYQDTWYYWNGGDARVHIPPASNIDAGHRNGVKVLGGCTFADPTNPNSSVFREMIAKNTDGTYKHAQKLVDMAEHYGFDGYAFNIEVTNYPSNVAVQTRGLFQEMNRIAEEKGMEVFELVYYYVHYNSGGRNFWIKKVDSGNDKWLEENGKTTFDRAFLNYEWDANSLQSSANFVKNNFPAGKNDPYDRVFAGLNMPAVFRGDARHPWKDLNNNPTSIAMWGESSWNDRWGHTAVARMDNYRDRAMDLWSGPNRTPSQPGTPINSSGKTKRVAGMASHVTAKSVIASYPLATTFNDGFGLFFNKKGEQVSDKAWNNVSIQDIVPTWRWWWSEGGASLEAGMDFSEAYDAGGSLAVEGSLGSGNNLLRLFKTKLAISGQTRLSLTYKVDGASQGQASNLELALAFENGESLSGFTFHPAGATQTEGWNTVEFDLAQHSGQTLAVIGLNFKGQASGYKINLGGLCLTDGSETIPSMATGVNVDAVTMVGRKMSGRLTWDIQGSPRYNVDGNVKYFEVFQVCDAVADTVFVGRSVARAIAFENIKRSAGNGNVRFLVQSVGLDGKTRSAFADNGTPVAIQPKASPAFEVPGGVNLNEPMLVTNLSESANTYAWTFEDGQPATSTSANPSGVVFTSPGVKTITLTVENEYGSETLTKTVTVNGENTNLALGKPSITSSGEGSGTFAASKGNDGDVTSTAIPVRNPTAYLFWEVDLGSQVAIGEIKAWNRHNCCQSRLTDYYIFISPEPFNSSYPEEVRNQPGVFEYHEPSTMGKPSVYDFNGQAPTGRYIRIQRRTTQTTDMGVGEIEVFGQYMNETALSLNASMTMADTEITLNETSTLSVAFNQAVTGLDIADFTVPNGSLSALSSTDGGETFTAIYTPDTDIADNTNVITLDLAGVVDEEGNSGQGVVQTANFTVDTEENNAVVNLALNQSTSQSSTGWGGLSPRAVDGNTSGVWTHWSVTHTKAYTSQPYWTVDLGEVAEIDFINVYNRSDCCSQRLSNFHVLVSEQPFTQSSLSGSQNQAGVIDIYHAGQGEFPSVLRINATGRYIRIQLEGNVHALSLAEVEVMGRYITAPAMRTSGLVQEDAEVIPSEINLFPNPANDVLNVVAPEMVMQFAVYDAKGNEVVSFDPASREFVLNVADYPVGMYVIRMVTESGTGIQTKFLKR
ncbi:hypothetical protein FUAX_09320 [Fulvitalea axinellae]|uniref:Mannosyl-glycoprotein endo-beta-N-acetylglucosaminidase n=1 Tax=Fulvitalea axinellae TaxID=1182444 RepID=A0AAU9DCD5_9BACT|nr:hypothetical protein FUAX_09320 [Fulvitalea axinellae]